MVNLQKIFMGSLIGIIIGSAAMSMAQDTIDEPLRACTIEEASDAVSMWFDKGFDEDYFDAVDMLQEVSFSNLDEILEMWLDLHTTYFVEIVPKLEECHVVQMHRLALSRVITHNVISLSVIKIGILEGDDDWMDFINPVLDIASEYYSDLTNRYVFLLVAAEYDD